MIKIAEYEHVAQGRGLKASIKDVTVPLMEHGVPTYTKKVGKLEQKKNENMSIWSRVYQNRAKYDMVEARKWKRHHGVYI